MLFCKLSSGILFRSKLLLPLEGCFEKKSVKRILPPDRKTSTSSEEIDVEAKSNPQRKLVRVALLGRTNSGKSTLINQMVDLNLCDASSKTHTTRMPLRAAFLCGDTQIVFVDTPGLVSKQEFRRFSLIKDFLTWKKNIFNEVDIVGLMYEAFLFRGKFKFHSSLIQIIDQIPESKPVFLVINKIDLIKNKMVLSEMAEQIVKSKKSEYSKENYLNRFSKVFFISALKKDGISYIVDYLLENASPNEWLLEPGKVFDVPLILLIKNLVRAKMLSALPQEIPYNCSYDVEYLEENELGRIHCVALVLCGRKKYLPMIIKKKNELLRKIGKELESDLYNICKKVVKVRIIVKLKPGL